LSRDDGDLETRVNLADAYRLSSAEETAEAQYRAVLRRAPGNVEAHIGLGELRLAIADRERDADAYEEAQRRFTRALALGRCDAGSKPLLRCDPPPQGPVMRPRSQREKTDPPVETCRSANRAQVADIYYLRGYALVRRYEVLGLMANRSMLSEALGDFRTCKRLNPSHSKAGRAIAKLEQSTARMSVQSVEEKLAPALVAGLSILVFALIQLSFYIAWPVERVQIAAYTAVTFTTLMFLIAGLVLPRLLRLKVGGLELEKTSATQVAAPTSLGITR
jgi:tetratricopeptide (TPR) repeat protein